MGNGSEPETEDHPQMAAHEAIAELEHIREQILKLLSDISCPFADKEQELYPYGILDRPTREDKFGVLVPIQVFTRQKSRREIKEIMLEIYDKIHDQEFWGMDGLKLKARYDSQLTFLKPCGTIHHGIINFTMRPHNE